MTQENLLLLSKRSKLLALLVLIAALNMAQDDCTCDNPEDGDNPPTFFTITTIIDQAAVALPLGASAGVGIRAICGGSGSAVAGCPPFEWSGSAEKSKVWGFNGFPAIADALAQQTTVNFTVANTRPRRPWNRRRRVQVDAIYDPETGEREVLSQLSARVTVQPVVFDTDIGDAVDLVADFVTEARGSSFAVVVDLPTGTSPTRRMGWRGARLMLSPTHLNFGTVKKGANKTLNFTISNRGRFGIGTGPLFVSISKSGANSFNFQVITGDLNVPSRGSLTLPVKFFTSSFDDPGVRSAQINFVSNATGSRNASITLSAIVEE